MKYVQKDKNYKPHEFIANYDVDPSYLYKTFWKGREYEHLAEIELLNKIFNNYVYGPYNTEQVFLDLGGSFGRLAQFYAGKFRYSIIGDYSVQELLEAKKNLGNKYKDLKFVALNAYKMPFKDSVIDYVLSVRLAHHIKNLDIFAKEIYRVLKPGGVLVLEVANKNHIKNIVKNLVSVNRAFFKQEILKIEHNPKDAQGIDDKKGQISVIFNFSPKYVKQVFKEAGFKIKRIYPCSFLRSRALKKYLPTRFMLAIEKVLQKLVFFKGTPSLFYVLYKPQEEGFLEKTITNPQNFKELLVCPNGERLEINGANVLCNNKKADFSIKNQIYDLRDPRPEKVNF